MNNKETGNYGESIAAGYLKKNGYKIIETNFRVHNIAEIDIIATEKKTLVFVEVKLRRSLKYGYGREAVTKQKQHKIRLAAEYYVMTHKLSDVLCRFDVVEITVLGDDVGIELIKNAF